MQLSTVMMFSNKIQVPNALHSPHALISAICTMTIKYLLDALVKNIHNLTSNILQLKARLKKLIV